ncbi:MAG: sodium:solute symporter family protein [bacterium]
MEIIDYVLFGAYMLCVLGVGLYFYNKNETADDYYVGGRSISSTHVGLSVVATDVGGGFSIGLGGVGYIMGLSGSWLLFTGLVGAWLAAVFVIPHVKGMDMQHGMLTYPDFLRRRFGARVALLAALISGIGYMGFTGAQALAGATLASETIFTKPLLGLEPLQFSLYVIGLFTVAYTVIGGLKAVIHTDSIQWGVLLFGLIFLGIPFAVMKIGGWSSLVAALPAEFWSLGNVQPHGWTTFANWMITIIPIWLIGMTLYQRIYACKDVREAKRAWYIAGLFEYPVMAFAGVFLGMCSRVLYPALDSPELGLPRLIAEALPVGVTGIVIAAYFSAIMSTADSCLMAASGNFVNDIIQRYFMKQASHAVIVRVSQVATLVIGVGAIVIAGQFDAVLEGMLYAYGFMVGGLFIPTLGAFFWKQASRWGAFLGMLAGGLVTITLYIMDKQEQLRGPLQWFGDTNLDLSIFGILASAIFFVAFSYIMPDPRDGPPVLVEEPQAEEVMA